MLTVTPHGALDQAVTAQPAGVRHRGLRPLGSSLYCAQERSGPQGPSPTAFQNIHDASPDPLSATLLSIHMVTSTSLLQVQAGSQALNLLRSGAPKRAPDLTGICTHETWRCRPGYTCSNQDDPSLSPLRHGCIPSLCKNVMSGCEGGFAHRLAKKAAVGPQSGHCLEQTE